MMVHDTSYSICWSQITKWIKKTSLAITVPYLQCLDWYRHVRAIEGIRQHIHFVVNKGVAEQKDENIAQYLHFKNQMFLVESRRDRIFSCKARILSTFKNMSDISSALSVTCPSCANIGTRNFYCYYTIW